MRECLSLFTKLGPKSIMRVDTESLLGAALAGQKKFDEAEKLLTQTADIMRRNAPRLSPDSQRRGKAALKRVIDFYEARGNAQEADHWRKLRDEAFPPKQK